jgi:hypothetical protein
MIQIKEKGFQEVKEKLNTLKTDLSKMEYLEAVLKPTDCVMEVKKFAYLELASLYEKRLMFDKAAKAMFAKAGYEVTFREKIDSSLKAAEYYVRAGNIMAADDMFMRAMREGNSEQQAKVVLTRKNVYLAIAKELEQKSRSSVAAKYYEHLLTFKLDQAEKDAIKKKLIDYYKKIGKINEARSVESK